MKFKFPQIWDTVDWQELFNSSDESIKWLILAQGRLSLAIRYLYQSEVSPEKLGWLILWTRAFQAVEDGKALLNSNAVFATELLNRSLHESQIDLNNIIQNHKTSSEREMLYGMHIGLRDYVTWCLWNDYIINDEKLNRRDMDKVYNAEPALSFYQSDFNIQLFPGNSNIETDQETLNRERRKHEEQLHAKSENIQELVSQLGLGDEWKDLKKAKKDRNWFSSFPDFLNDTKTNMRKQMHKQGIGYGYSTYQTLSNIAHGSTIDFFAHIDDKEVIPKIMMPDQSVQEGVDKIANTANWIAVILTTIAQKSQWGGE